jgi:MerR family Zn(II)-responsive transcriptional regulator of zntA
LPNDEREGDFLSTGDMARMTGNTLRTVRFYEEAGILNPERRSAGGHRLFSKIELQRLQLISDLRAAGLSLDEIRALLEVKAKSTTAVGASTTIIAEVDKQLAVLDQRIAVLSKLRTELATARNTLQVCRTCTDVGFPDSCLSCDKLTTQGAVPASLGVLWGLRDPH